MSRLDTLAIVGLGLMGASLGLAAKRRGVAGRVVGYARRAETRDAALARGMVDAVAADPAEAVRGADLVVFCLPVLSTAQAVQACRAGWTGREVITDVGSTKAELHREIEAVLAGTGVHFVGSHPIAGSDRTGLEAARADLYEQAVVVITPPDGRQAPGMDRVVACWEAVGAVVKLMTPDGHDRTVARTSHLPHLVAAALASAVLGTEAESRRLLCGSGFRDSTRIAAGSEELWHDILRTNHAAVAGALDEFDHELAQVRRLLAGGDFAGLKHYLATAREQRRAFGAGRPAATPPTESGA